MVKLQVRPAANACWSPHLNNLSRRLAYGTPEEGNDQASCAPSPRVETDSTPDSLPLLRGDGRGVANSLSSITSRLGNFLDIAKLALRGSLKFKSKNSVAPLDDLRNSSKNRSRPRKMVLSKNQRLQFKHKPSVHTCDRCPI